MKYGLNAATTRIRTMPDLGCTLPGSPVVGLVMLQKVRMSVIKLLDEDEPPSADKREELEQVIFDACRDIEESLRSVKLFTVYDGSELPGRTPADRKRYYAW